ncbi:MAG: UDP-N-acetylglucosamine 2-epimerase [Candidatus Daviesbacteria bacterium]|nr:UDP-N-acetylglucosamine 2-epimerase [Candidatus Daviesbacteria bacterium]
MGTVEKKVYFFMGTTAEFIKLAPVIKEFKKQKIKFKVITSGQNPINFDDLKGYIGLIKTDIALKEKPRKSSMFSFVIWAFQSLFEGIISLKKEFQDLNKNNSYFIVHGDTVSSTIGSLIAKFHGFKLAHIESGLRSFSFLEPFPEEICRVINMRLADILFCPNQWAINNIKTFKGTKIDTKQNTLIEAFTWAMKTNKNLDFKQKYKKYYILYIRRQEHLYFQKEWTGKIINTILNNAPADLNCLFSIHFLNKDLLPKNLTRNRQDKLITIEKLPYTNFMKLMSQAEFIATDGCTNQEEASYMGLPVLALRNRTERIEGLGKNVIISQDNEHIIKNFLKNYKKYRKRPIQLNERPSTVIVDYLLNH